MNHQLAYLSGFKESQLLSYYWWIYSILIQYCYYWWLSIYLFFQPITVFLFISLNSRALQYFLYLLETSISFLIPKLSLLYNSMNIPVQDPIICQWIFINTQHFNIRWTPITYWCTESLISLNCEYIFYFHSIIFQSHTY
jgi:hypothetical protein